MINFQVKRSFQEKIEKGFEEPVYFANEFLEKELHKEQEIALKGMLLKDAFVNCGNRWGKGDLIAVKQSWIAFYKPVAYKFKDKLVNLLNTSISQDQANIILNKFEEDFTDIKNFSWIIKDIKKSPFPHIIFRNKVTWWFRNASLNGKYLEGRNYFDINFDESDLYPDYKKFVEGILEPRAWDMGGQISHTTTPRRGKKNSYKCVKCGNCCRAGLEISIRKQDMKKWINAGKYDFVEKIQIDPKSISPDGLAGYHIEEKNASYHLVNNW